MRSRVLPGASTTRHESRAILDGSSSAPALRRSSAIAHAQFEFWTKALAVKRKATGAGRLFDRANNAASSIPNCEYQRSISQRGCDVSIESFSIESGVLAVGS